MAHDRRPDGFEAFDSRMRRLRGQGAGGNGDGGPPRRAGFAGSGPAFQAGIEVIAGVVGGALIGYALDHWLGTGPWLLIALFLLGAAGGMRNAWRRLSRMGRTGAGADGETRDGRP
jgi:ATP synthase protein I